MHALKICFDIEKKNIVNHKHLRQRDEQESCKESVYPDYNHQYNPTHDFTQKYTQQQSINKCYKKNIKIKERYREREKILYFHTWFNVWWSNRLKFKSFSTWYSQFEYRSSWNALWSLFFFTLHAKILNTLLNSSHTVHLKRSYSMNFISAFSQKKTYIYISRSDISMMI